MDIFTKIIVLHKLVNSRLDNKVCAVLYIRFILLKISPFTVQAFYDGVAREHPRRVAPSLIITFAYRPKLTGEFCFSAPQNSRFLPPTPNFKLGPLYDLRRRSYGEH